MAASRPQPVTGRSCWSSASTDSNVARVSAGDECVALAAHWQQWCMAVCSNAAV
jgi:hypothetical protein